MESNIFEFWKQIKLAGRIHPEDSEILDRKFHSFDLGCLPGPYFGPLRDARVVLLYLSPGWAESAVTEASTDVAQKRYLKQRQGCALLPLRDEDFELGKWWTERTRVFDKNWRRLCDKVAFLNIGAYKSEAFNDYPLLASLPSCRVSLNWAQSELFPEAIAGEKTVICMRSARYWGLEPGKQYGKSLYAPLVARNGHMCHGPCREKIVTEVKERLKS